ncbi:MAG TPA: hypothetical protein ENK07_02940, partial [Bacteroidetes bacterium]|nr:hypothetical protein [Bacteroidota bacterium]
MSTEPNHSLRLDEVAVVISHELIRKALRWALILIGLAATLWILVKLQSIVILFVLSFVLASLLEP